MKTRENFGARNKAEARRTARVIASQLLDNYLDVGQPYDEAHDNGLPEEDADRLAAAVHDLARQIEPKKKM